MTEMIKANSGTNILLHHDLDSGMRCTSNTTLQTKTSMVKIEKLNYEYILRYLGKRGLIVWNHLFNYFNVV